MIFALALRTQPLRRTPSTAAFDASSTLGTKLSLTLALPRCGGLLPPSVYIVDFLCEPARQNFFPPRSRLIFKVQETIDKSVIQDALLLVVPARRLGLGPDVAVQLGMTLASGAVGSGKVGVFLDKCWMTGNSCDL